MPPRVRVLALVLVVAGVAAGAFLVGRASVEERPAQLVRGSFADGYRSGREDAFSGYDGGWAYGEPYIVTLRRGGAGITYRFARRWPMLPGRTYRRCGSEVCSR